MDLMTVKRGGLSEAEFEKALTDPDDRIRRAAIETGGASETQSKRALGDIYIDVQKAAKTQLSLINAKALAVDKEACELPGFEVKKIFAGHVIGVCDLHIVQSLGRTAAVHLKANLSRIVGMGEMITVTYDGGCKAWVKPEKMVLDNPVGIGR